MRRGAWHQFGDKSQKMTIEQIQNGAGVGVILSPRDLTKKNATKYASIYHGLGAHVLMDQQFYNPDYSNSNLVTYPISQFRAAISQLAGISDQDLVELSSQLRIDHSEIEADGLIAPAVMYEAGRPDIVQLNKRLFSAAKLVGDELTIPTYATVMLGRSVTASDTTVNTILSEVTSLDSSGWYFGFEFGNERIPSSKDAVLRCCVAGLTLACTGKPVLHAYAGPLALLSLGFGATGAGVGHSQNLWQFTRGRWEASAGGGGGDAPPRFFSRSLWGTIVYPDETALLSPALRNAVLTQSPFSTPTASGGDWNRWDANKHLVSIICSTVQAIANDPNPRANAAAAIALLDGAIALHAQIKAANLNLRDSTNVYQGNWREAMNELLNNHEDDFDYLDLLL